MVKKKKQQIAHFMEKPQNKLTNFISEKMNNDAVVCMAYQLPMECRQTYTTEKN